MRFSTFYKFVFMTALILMIVALLAYWLILEYGFGQGLNQWWIVLGFFLALILVLSYSMRRYIRTQLGKVYDAAIFENEPHLKKSEKEVDFRQFIEKIKGFTEKKVEEIEKLTSRDDFRREYMGDVAHELKTPLFTAQGYLLTVLDGDIDDPDLEKKYLERSKKSLDRLGSILKDLDLLASLESGTKLEQETFNIFQSIQEVMDMLEYAAEKKKISLLFEGSVDFPILVVADKEKIEQVLINLIQNSIKYGVVGGETRVKVTGYTKHKIMVQIKDNGQGIHKKDKARLFERFFRVDKSRSREHGGSGLGLAIVKHIMEAHKQEVFVQSKPGKGSVFSFTLNRSE